MIVGYKGTDSNMTCKSFKFELGQEYVIEKGNITMCAVGFHFCPNIKDVFNFYFDKNSRFFEVEADKYLDFEPNDKKIVCSQIKLTKEIFPYNIDFPNHRELMLELCKLTPYSLTWIPQATKTNDFLMEVIQAVPEAIEYVTNPTTEMMLEAVKAYGPTILFLPKASDEIKMEAVKQHWYSIRHISNPAEGIQFEAVYNSLDALHFIDNPTNAVKAYVQGVIDGSVDPIPPGGINYDGIYLNEICGADSNNLSWVEIINTSSYVKTIGEMKITSGSSSFTIPKNTKIQPKSVLAFSSNDGLFKISNSAQVVLYLKKPDGSNVDEFNRNAWFSSGHIVGGSYARIPDGTGDWVIETNNTIGELNSEIGVSPKEMIRFNEICGANENADDDWIELINLSDTDVDLTGFTLLKDDGNQIFQIPNGSIIKANGLLSFNNVRDGMFKISNSKSVNLAIETNDGDIIDFFDKDVNIGSANSHPIGGSYVRIPDGTGDWSVSNKNSLGEFNEESVIIPDVDNYIGLVINEVCVGDGDWVELYNNSNNSLDLEGCKLFLGSTLIKEFVNGDYLASKTFLALDSPTDTEIYKNAIVKLLSPNNNTIDEFNKNGNFGSYRYHKIGGSYSRIPDGTGVWCITDSASKGSVNIEDFTNTFPSPSNFENIILNEICGGDLDVYDNNGKDDNNDWVEIYNNNDTLSDISGLMIFKDGEPICVTPKDTTLEPKSYMVFDKKSNTLSSGISNSKAVEISLYSPYGVLLDEFNNITDIGLGSSHIIGGSYSRIPNITGAWNVTETCTKGEENIGEEIIKPEPGGVDYSN